MVHANELRKGHDCCPKCDHHYRLSATRRIELLADPGSFREFFQEIQPEDPLHFVDTESYVDRIKRAQEKTGCSEGVVVGQCRIEEMDVVLGVLDFDFMGGSMGSVVGERITLSIEHALSEGLPLVIVSSSGGARMQESVFSLMQMAKTSAALAMLHEAKIPYLSVLTNPTTGGVIASFASLGDITIAEPEALIGFAGPRVVEQTIRQKLPGSAQKSEFLLDRGMIDCVVRRKELKAKIAFFLSFLSKGEKVKTKANQTLQSLLSLSKKEKEECGSLATSESKKG